MTSHCPNLHLPRKQPLLPHQHWTKTPSCYVHKTVTHPHPSLCLSVFSSQPHPPLPPLVHRSCLLLHHTGSLLFLQTSVRVWKGTRPRGAGTRGGRGGRGCFRRSPAPVAVAGRTVVHPEEARLTSLWPGLGSTRAAWRDAVAPALPHTWGP